MNIQKFIEVYEKDVEELKVIAEENKGFITENATSIILVKQEVLVTSLKILQKEMRKYLGQFSDKLNKANVILAFGLGEKSETIFSRSRKP